MKKVYYYKDPLNDDFAGNNIRQKLLPADYPYITRNPFRRAFDFFLHHFLVTPIIFLFQKIVFGERLKGRRKLRPYLKDGFFLYGNHTRSAGDAFTPNLAVFPRKAYILINPDGVSIPVVRHLVKSLGGVPIPNRLDGMRNFLNAVRKLSEHNCIAIYPEAHIWPYYTGIRPFRDVSFRYPAETGKPVFCFTVTYHKRFGLSLPGTTVYIDGPFFSDQAMTVKEKQRALRDQVYEAMRARSGNSTYDHCTYTDVSTQGVASSEKAE